MQLRDLLLWKLAQAAICVLYLSASWGYFLRLEGTEFSGGTVTGPLLNLSDLGYFLFMVALVLTFFLRRTSAAIVVFAALLSFPLYTYFIAPGVFRRIFPGEYSVPLQGNFEWHIAPVSHALILLIAMTVGLRLFLAPASMLADS